MQTWAEEEEDYQGGTEITAVNAGEGITAKMVSANVGECGWRYEEMKTFLSMEGRSWQSSIPPSNNYQGLKQWGNHKIISRMTEDG